MKLRTFTFTFLLLGALVGCSRRDVDHAKRELHNAGQEAKQTAHKSAGELKKDEKTTTPADAHAPGIPDR